MPGKKGVRLSEKDRKDASAVRARINAGGLDTIADLYTTWLDAGRSSTIAAYGSSLAMADLLHSSGLLKDSMYGRIGSMGNVAFTADIIGQILSSGSSALSTLVEASDKHGRGKVQGKEEEEGFQPSNEELAGLIAMLPKLAAAVG